MTYHSAPDDVRILGTWKDANDVGGKGRSPCHDDHAVDEPQVQPHLGQSHDTDARRKHQNRNQNTRQAEGVVHHPMRHFIPPSAEPVGSRIGVAGDVLLIFCSREDVGNEGYEDGERKGGKHCTPYETEVVAVFGSFLRVGIFFVADVGTEPIQRANPSRLLLGRLAFFARLACGLILSYAFLCVHFESCLLYFAGAKIRNNEKKAKYLSPFLPYNIMYARFLSEHLVFVNTISAATCSVKLLHSCCKVTPAGF